MAYTVGEVARLANVSVRTLHHYDEIGLLEPSQRSDAGYRLYSDDDLERLQQILLYRELDFALEEIAQVLTDPGFDRSTRSSLSGGSSRTSSSVTRRCSRSSTRRSWQWKEGFD